MYYVHGVKVCCVLSFSINFFEHMLKIPTFPWDSIVLKNPLKKNLDISYEFLNYFLSKKFFKIFFPKFDKNSKT